MAVAHFTMDRQAMRRSLKVKLSTDRRVFGKAKTMARDAFNRWHDALLEEFDTHPVTVELKTAAEGDASSVENISGTTGGLGNLYGYLGFWEDEDPTEQLRGLLEKIKLDYRGLTATKDFHFAYNIPTLAAVYKASMLTAWGTSAGSWVDVVENGKQFGQGGAGISHYVPGSKGRSGAGVQITPTYAESASFQKTDYILSMLRKFSESPAGAKNVGSYWARGAKL